MRKGYDLATGELRPCKHMGGWVNRLAEERLTGLAAWYTRLHVAQCPHCRAALEALRELRSRLRSLREAPQTEIGEISPERRRALDAAFDELDAEHKKRLGGPLTD